jgi:uncharacterized protein YceK
MRPTSEELRKLEVELRKAAPGLTWEAVLADESPFKSGTVRITCAVDVNGALVTGTLMLPWEIWMHSSGTDYVVDRAVAELARSIAGNKPDPDRETRTRTWTRLERVADGDDVFLIYGTDTGHVQAIREKTPIPVSEFYAKVCIPIMSELPSLAASDEEALPLTSVQEDVAELRRWVIRAGWGLRARTFSIMAGFAPRTRTWAVREDRWSQ